MVTKREPQKSPEEIQDETVDEAAELEDVSSEEEVPTAPEEGEAAEEKLIMGKFKTQDDVITSYQELERFKSQLEQENADLRKQTEAVREAPEPEVKPPKLTPQQVLEKLYTDPRGTIAEVVRQELQEGVYPTLGEMRMQRAKEWVETREEYTDDLDQKLGGIVKEYRLGKGSNIPPERAVKMAYEILKGRRLAEVSEKMEEEGRRKEREAAEKKDKGYVEGAGKGPGSTGEIDLEGMSIEDMEKVLPHKEE